MDLIIELIAAFGRERFNADLKRADVSVKKLYANIQEFLNVDWNKLSETDLTIAYNSTKALVDVIKMSLARRKIKGGEKNGSK